ncbi:hypothetical protein OHB39_11855 [Streptomyces sp. NBC_00047]|nr:hypothetical protein [Streptomyces sp. NBC_00047]MCX5608256.1 hypothetical protein [Streptomyces sp. NBC_00047]
MFGKKSQSKPADLTSPAAVAKSQKVYDRIASGKCKDATTELDAAHKRKR